MCPIVSLVSRVPESGRDSATHGEYNHRLNRFGSYVLNLKGPDGAARTVAGHTSASGTGNDTAHFSEFVTQVDATDGLAFQSGHVAWGDHCRMPAR